MNCQLIATFAIMECECLSPTYLEHVGLCIYAESLCLSPLGQMSETQAVTDGLLVIQAVLFMGGVMLPHVFPSRDSLARLL